MKKYYVVRWKTPCRDVPDPSQYDFIACGGYVFCTALMQQLEPDGTYLLYNEDEARELVYQAFRRQVSAAVR